MPLQFDHAIINVHDLDTAIQDYEALGFTVKRGGVHIDRVTHNVLIVFLDGTYLELLAPTGEVPATGLVAGDEGLVGYALRCDDIEAEVARLKNEGFAVGNITPGGRTRDDGTRVEWKVALIDDHFAPFLIQDVTPRELRITTDPALTTHANRAIGMSGLDIGVRSITQFGEHYTKLLDAVPHQFAYNEWQIGMMMLHESRLKDVQAMDKDLPAIFSVSPMHFARLKREESFAATLGEKASAPHAINLIREAGTDQFALRQTHNTRFNHHPGLTHADIHSGIRREDWNNRPAPIGQGMDIPYFLMLFLSKPNREYALKELHAAVKHEGVVFEASVEIIPALLKFMESPDAETRIDLLKLMEAVLSGTPWPSQLAERRDTFFRAGMPTYESYLNHPNAELRQLATHLMATYS